MPTRRNRAVRHWLKSGRAKVVRREPFTIQLVNRDGGCRQPLTAGIDLGTAHVGVSVVSGDKEVLAAEFKLRKDIKGLIDQRRMFRRSRRGRKTRHRRPRFLNRKQQDELAPSVRSKVDETLKIVKLVGELLPVKHWVFEVANFDTHKLVNPDVDDYRKGPKHGFDNVRAYVLWRDKHTCQACRGKSKDPRMQAHHIVFRSQGGSDRPGNLITLCSTCHWKHHNEQPLTLRKPKNYCAPTQFNVVKSYVMRATVNLSRRATYGHITKAKRSEIGLEKSYINDAFVVAGGECQQRADSQYLGVFKRRQNRKLSKGDRSHIRNTIPNAFGFRRGDRVKLPSGQEKKINRLEQAKTLSIERLLLPRLMSRVSAA